MEALKPTPAAEAVARHIEALILEGALRPGEVLLPERELAARLGVSRPTLRDGLKALGARGLLVTHGARGLAVARLGEPLIADPLIALLSSHAGVVDDYLEFRGLLEAGAARMAAVRANDLDRAALREAMAAVDQAHDAGEPEGEAAADADLHMAIYEASHNVVLLQIMRALSGKLRADVQRNRARLFTIPSVRDLLRDQHRALTVAILSGDAVAAELAAAAHIEWLRQATREVRTAEAQLETSRRRLDGGRLSRR